jgi:hypothetical protein
MKIGSSLKSNHHRQILTAQIGETHGIKLTLMDGLFVVDVSTSGFASR